MDCVEFKSCYIRYRIFLAIMRKSLAIFVVGNCSFLIKYFHEKVSRKTLCCCLFFSLLSDYARINLK